MESKIKDCLGLHCNWPWVITKVQLGSSDHNANVYWLCGAFSDIQEKSTSDFNKSTKRRIVANTVKPLTKKNTYTLGCDATHQHLGVYS